MIKGYPVGDEWRKSVCCHYLHHNSHCSPDIHYCVDHLEENHNLNDDVDFFQDAQSFTNNLALIMSTAPPDSALCGLEGFGNQLPFVNIGEGNELAVDIGPTSAAENLPDNTVCKIRINTNAQDSDKQLSFTFGKLPEYIRSAYIVEVNEKKRLLPEQGQKFSDSLSSWPIVENQRMVFTNEESVKRN